VVMVADNSPAAEAGLRASSETRESDGVQVPVGGDIIIGINDRPVAKFDDLISYLSRESIVGDTVVLTILRDGDTLQIDVTLEARPR
jgi:serine protease Do